MRKLAEIYGNFPLNFPEKCWKFQFIGIFSAVFSLQPKLGAQKPLEKPILSVCEPSSEHEISTEILRSSTDKIINALLHSASVGLKGRNFRPFPSEDLPTALWSVCALALSVVRNM